MDEDIVGLQRAVTARTWPSATSVVHQIRAYPLCATLPKSGITSNLAGVSRADGARRSPD